LEYQVPRGRGLTPTRRGYFIGVITRFAESPPPSSPTQSPTRTGDRGFYRHWPGANLQDELPGERVVSMATVRIRTTLS
jgi:hypothetical protein